MHPTYLSTTPILSAFGPPCCPPRSAVPLNSPIGTIPKNNPHGRQLTIQCLRLHLTCMQDYNAASCSRCLSIPLPWPQPLLLQCLHQSFFCQTWLFDNVIGISSTYRPAPAPAPWRYPLCFALLRVERLACPDMCWCILIMSSRRVFQ
jgi:hypothetical protein